MRPETGSAPLYRRLPPAARRPFPLLALPRWYGRRASGFSNIGGSGGGALPPGNFFSTNFPVDQTPLAAPWIVSSATNFPAWGYPGNPPDTRPFCVGGVARGNANSQGNDDSVAFLDPNIYGVSTNQHVTSVVSITGAFGVAEVEQHLCSNFGSGFIHTIEIDWVDSLSTVFLVSWVSTSPGVGVVQQTSAAMNLSDNDVLEAIKVGNLYTVKQNGTTLINNFSFVDANFTTGTMGLGFDIGSGNNLNIGLKSWSATWS